MYFNLGDLASDAEHLTRAYELRHRVSERERLTITGDYHNRVTGDLQRAVEAHRLVVQTYPSEEISRVVLTALYSKMGRFAEALEEAAEVDRLFPSPVTKTNLASAYLRENRLQEARAVCEESLTRWPSAAWSVHLLLYRIAFAEGDTGSLDRHAEEAAVERVLAIRMLADAAASRGRMRESRELQQQAIEELLQVERKDSAAAALAQSARREAELGTAERAREQAHRALAMTPARETLGAAAFALARAGDRETARAVAADLARDFPDDTLIQAVWVPGIRGEISMHEDQPADTIDLLRSAIPYERGQLELLYLRGRAYLQIGSGPEAEREFQKIVDLRGVEPTAWPHTLARLGLARARALQGDEEGSRRAYDRFFTLWQGADPDLPQLLEARAEFAERFAASTTPIEPTPLTPGLLTPGVCATSPPRPGIPLATPCVPWH